MTSLPPFLILLILVEFVGSSDEGILILRAKREKRPKT